MKTNTTKEDGKNPMAGMTDAALKNCEQAFRAGLKLQEQAGQWWSSMVSQGAGTVDWQQKLNNVTSMANKLVPLAQERMDEVIALAEHNGRSGAELVKQAMAAAQTPGIADSQAKWMEFWTSSFGVARTNAEAFMKINSKALDSWIAFIQKNTEVTEIRMPKAA